MDLLKNKNYLAALEFIASNDLNSLPNGKNVIDGDELYVNVVDSEMKSVENAKYEAHRSYIDIQVPLSGPESFGVAPVCGCKAPEGEFNAEKDCILFGDKVSEGAVFTAQPGQIVIFSPEDAHAPLIGSGKIHKAIFKVKVK